MRVTQDGPAPPWVPDSTPADTVLERLVAAYASAADPVAARTMRAYMKDVAPFLGLNGIVVKSHGGANAAGIASALRVAVDLARSDYAQEIQANLQQLTQVLERGRPSGSAEAESRS